MNQKKKGKLIYTQSLTLLSAPTSGVTSTRYFVLMPLLLPSLFSLKWQPPLRSECTPVAVWTIHLELERYLGFYTECSNILRMLFISTNYKKTHVLRYMGVKQQVLVNHCCTCRCGGASFSAEELPTIHDCIVCFLRWLILGVQQAFY